MDLTGRHFLKLLDYTPEEINYFIDLAAELKRLKKAGIPVDTLRGKNVALIFEKTSTRTRSSFEVAAHDLGMGCTYLDPSSSQIGKKESIRDTARVLGRMFEGIEYRGYGQEIVEELAKYAGVPVWNGLTNEFHPTQMLADDSRASWKAERRESGLYGRRPLQHGQFLHGRMCEDGHALYRLRSVPLFPGQGSG